MSKYDFKLDMTVENSLSLIIKMLKPNSVILEFGPAHGRLTKYLLEELHCRVYIVEKDLDAITEAKKYAYDYINGDIEDFIWLKRFANVSFDYIIFADVIEHLYNPKLVLENALRLLKDTGSILLSLPNFSHNAVLIDLLRNEFSYHDTGLLDENHVRFFTYKSINDLFAELNLVPVSQYSTNAKVGEIEIDNKYQDLPEEVSRYLKLRPFGEVYQFVFELKKKSHFAKERIKDYLIKDCSYYFAQLYFTKEGQYEENNSLKVDNPQNVNLLSFDLSNTEGVKKLRLDIINASCIVKINKCELETVDNRLIEVNMNRTNACLYLKNLYFFLENDPQMEIIIPDEEKITHLIVNYEFVEFGVKNNISKIIRDLNAYYNTKINNIQVEYNALIDKQNTKYERLLNKYKGLLSYEQEVINDRMRLSSQRHYADYLEQRINLIYHSYSWKITKIFRIMLKRKSKKPPYEILQRNDLIIMNIDAAMVKKQKLFLRGWAFSKINEKLEISVANFKKDDLFCEQETRSDVFNYYNGDYQNLHCGFKLTVSNINKEEAVIVKIHSEKDAIIVSFNPYEIAQKYRVKLITKKNLKNTVKHLKKYGLNATIKQIKAYALGEVQQDYDPEIAYQKWIKNHENYKKQEVKQKIHKFMIKPKISILVPVYNVEERWLKRCIESVINQYYENWELCIADDNSTLTYIKPLLSAYQKADSRIKVVFRDKNGHISRATNSALEIATGEYIALLDNDDELAPFALYEVVKHINEHPESDLIYSDEDKTDLKGIRRDPHFKPDYSPDTLLSSNYISHLGIYRRSLVIKAGGFRTGYEGSQDYDLVLRFVEMTDKIYHIPKILYHWRMVEGSTALMSASKSYAYEAGFRALNDAINRRNLLANVKYHGEVPYYVMEYDVLSDDFVSIIIPTKDNGDILDKCLYSIYTKTQRIKYEIIIVDNGSTEENTFKVFSKYREIFPDFQILTLDIPFNYSKLNNEAVKLTKGNYILLLNNDIEVITHDWLKIMVGYARQKHIGAVGAKLLYPDDTIQHGGVILGVGGVANHAFLNHDRNSPGYYARLKVPYNYSAVTGACLAVKKDKYLEAGGLDENLMVAFNDIDFNLKLLKIGYYNVFLPQVELYHYESKSRGKDDTNEKLKRFNNEVKYMVSKWGDILSKDPFYNPNLSYQTTNFRINS